MKLRLGRIGQQEAVSLCALTMSISSIFTMDSSIAYSKVNGAYITLPLSAGLTLAVFLLIAFAMRRAGAKELSSMCESAFGKIGADILAVISVIVLCTSAWELLFRFASMLHTSIYSASRFASVTLWVAACPALMSYLGFECIGRMGKIFAAAIGVLFILGFAGASSSFETYRLYPLPWNAPDVLLLQTLEGTGRCFPALLAMLCAADALQGGRFLKRTGIIASCICAGMGALSQLCLGLVYSSTDLSKMYMPLYRLNMLMIKESYWFRLDKLGLFMWFIGCAIGAALYIYSASLLIAKRLGGCDVRPPSVSISAFLACLMMFTHISEGGTLGKFLEFSQKWAWATLVPFALAAVVSLVRSRKGKGMKNEIA